MCWELQEAAGRRRRKAWAASSSCKNRLNMYLWRVGDLTAADWFSTESCSITLSDISWALRTSNDFSRQLPGHSGSPGWRFRVSGSVWTSESWGLHQHAQKCSIYFNVWTCCFSYNTVKNIIVRTNGSLFELWKLVSIIEKKIFCHLWTKICPKSLTK